jgi:hypothetical protein
MAALAPEIKQRVKEFWADWKARSSGERISTRALFREYRQKVSNNEIGLSKFNEIVRELERNAPSDPFPCSEWKPWVNQYESPEDSAFLLRISTIMQIEIGRTLYSHEAKWGRRLRVALEGLHPFGQYRFVLHYSLREVIAYHLRAEQYTADLDALITYRAWRVENWGTYALALASGSAPYPVLEPLIEPGDPSLPPEELEQMNRFFGTAWGRQLYGMLKPWGTFIPDREDNPDKARMLDWLLRLWAGIEEQPSSTEEKGGVDEQVNQETQ